MKGKPNYDNVYDRLFAWCEARGFAGTDPFDGLNSRIFQRLPFNESRLARLGMIQAVKRSPVDLRPLLRVPAGVNPKAIALFALAELSRYRTTDNDKHAVKARSLLDSLLEMGIRDGDTLSFGYNFDWQSRMFFAPAGFPAIVPTSFASQAFHEGVHTLNDQGYMQAVEAIARFVTTRLNRPVETADEVCFSYTPADQSVIYNASLLAAECLERSSDREHRDLACKAVKFVLSHQREDGSWTYGNSGGQQWVDNFHTAYVLVSLDRLSNCSETKEALASGKAYWITSFFLPNGLPRYYNSQTYPVDIHSAAVAIAAAAELREIDLAEKVARWTIRNMRDSEGFFYYRVGRVLVDQTPHMRWGQAWMAYALARLIEAGN